MLLRTLLAVLLPASAGAFGPVGGAPPLLLRSSDTAACRRCCDKALSGVSSARMVEGSGWWRTRGRSKLDSMPSAADVGTALGLPGPWEAPKWVWKVAWVMQKRAMPLLHSFDECAPADTCLNLNVLWWKAIAGNRKGSPTYDGGLAYDLLPPVTRGVVQFPLCWAYPNLHHQNVALRTAFIDRVVTERVTRAAAAGRRVRLVGLGAGFDTRSLRLEGVWCAAEIDLPDVVAQKKEILARLAKRRPEILSRPTLLAADLNDAAQTASALREAMGVVGPADGVGGARDQADEHTVFVCEALMIYLDDAAATRLVRLCRDAAAESGGASFCFADRLPGVPGGDRLPAERLFSDAGFELEEWLPKPGLARHMGAADRPELAR